MEPLVPPLTSERIEAVISDDPDCAGVMQTAVELEDNGTESWGWPEVGAHPAMLRRLAREGVLDIVEQAENLTYYALHDRKLTRETLKRTDDVLDKSTHPPQLFDTIVGYDAEKEFIRRAVASPVPIHCLLVGPPASGKSLFLFDILRLPKSRLCLGGSTTKAGLARFLIDMKDDVDYLIIDEIEKAQSGELSTLLSLMESQVVTEMKAGRTRERRLKTKVFAAGNSVDMVPRELLSRFARFRFNPYSAKEFIEVCRRTLMLRENVEPDLAEYIAEGCYGNGLRDVRDAIRISKMSKDKEEAAWNIALLRNF